MPRLALGLEYVGSRFCGWQRQEGGASVQQCLEDAVSGVADMPVNVVAAGRTDAGVHAFGQVVHFEAGVERSERSWLLGVNSNLPADISVSWVRPVGERFHARYSAVARSYRYLILNAPARSALLHERAWWLHGGLDADAMHQGAQLLLGEHDFSSFRGAQCQARSPMREVQAIRVARRGGFLMVDCRANAFLHHMVRNIVGSLLRVGRGEEPPDWLSDVLAARDRRRAGMTAPPQGLYLLQVHYPPEHAIPAPELRWPGDL